MSIIADIKQAKATYHAHLAEHGCRDAFAMRRDGLEPCRTRAELIVAWTGTAGMWATEPDDETRQRDHFNRNNPLARPA